MKYAVLFFFAVSMVYGGPLPSNFTKINHTHKNYPDIMNIRQDILKANLRYQGLVILLESTGKDIKAIDKAITDKRDQTKWKMRENHKMLNKVMLELVESQMMFEKVIRNFESYVDLSQ